MPANEVKKKLTVGDLFSGIGGFSLGLEWTGGFETKWFVEIDPFCNKVLEKHWPNVRRYRDVKEVGKHNLEPVDLICGGFPCQDISFAGVGNGIYGERSGLWFEFARVIREMGPRFVIVENVSAILIRGMSEVLGTLASIGYDAEWDMLPAAFFGSPHIRRRIWIVAYPNGSVGTDGILQKGRIETIEKREKGFWGYDWSKFKVASRPSEILQRWSEGTTVYKPPLVRMDDGIPDIVDRLKSLGNAVVPQIVYQIGKAIMEVDGKC